MVEIGIVGAKNSGKTTLIEQLIPLFVQNGLEVATIKHTGHSHTFDTEGKDSYRHRKSGAGLTIALSNSELAVFTRPEDKYLNVVKEIIVKYFDLCLVEGDKQSNRPKVLLTANREQLKRPISDNVIVSYGIERHSSSIAHYKLNDVAGLSSFLLKQVANLRKEQ